MISVANNEFMQQQLAAALVRLLTKREEKEFVGAAIHFHHIYRIEDEHIYKHVYIYSFRL